MGDGVDETGEGVRGANFQLCSQSVTGVATAQTPGNDAAMTAW